MNLKKASVLLGLCLLLAGCRNNEDKIPAESAAPQPTEMNTEGTKAPDETEKEETEVADTEAEGEEAEETTSPLESEDEATRMEALMKESDYISLVEPGTGADNRAELRFLANYKGDLSLIKFEGPTDLEKNHQYLIFYKDDENGDIVPTSAKYPYVEVDGSNDVNLMKVQKHYEKQTDEEKTTNKNDAKVKDLNNKNDTKAKDQNNKKETASPSSTKVN